MSEQENLYGWINVKEGTPPIPKDKPGLMSEPVLVISQEFGQPPTVAVARCWQSALPHQPLKWYMDRDFYHIDEVMEAGEVIYWKPIMPLPDIVFNYFRSRICNEIKTEGLIRLKP